MLIMLYLGPITFFQTSKSLLISDMRTLEISYPSVP